MKVVRKIIALTVMLFGMIGWAGDSAPFLLDTTDPLITAPITYNSSWVGGDSSAEVVISADGTEIKRTTGEGEFAWAPTTSGKHTLTYTTYIDGVAQEEVYAATVFKDWKYTVEDGNATIIGTTQTSGDVTIPSEIDGIPVVGIGSDVFVGADIKSVTMPLAILEGDGEQTPQVEKNNWIEGEDGVYQSNDINDYESTSMTLEVKGPCDFSFDWKVSSESNYDKLKWYLDGSQISEISGTGNGWQTVSYSISEGFHTIRWEYSKDGSVSNGDDCGWVRFTESVSASMTMSNLFPHLYTAITNVVLTGEGERIPANAFAGCTSLQNVEVPESVTNIGQYAFAWCNSLTGVKIPNSVISIGYGSFMSCNSELYDATTISGVIMVDGWAIEVDRSKLPAELDLTGIRGISGNIFQNCTSLERVVIPDGVKGIGDSAFHGCEALAEVSLPDGLTGDIKSAFSGTPFVISDTFPEFILSRSGKSLYGIKAKMFDTAMDWDDVWNEMKSVKILVPATVEYVGDYVLGALSAYIYDSNLGEYYENNFTSGQDSVIFMGAKPSASEKAFMYPGAEDDIARDEIYYYEGNDGWVWNEDWCGVKTYSLPNIPEEYKVASDCTFGRTYGGGWWTDEWMSDGELMQFSEYELWDNNDVGLYGDELAFFPVMTTESSIKPYVLLDDTPAAYLDEVEVWTDEQVRMRFIPTGVSVGDWVDDGACWEYEAEYEYWSWPKDLWPDNRVVAGRKWIVVPVCEVKEKWSGVSSFRVGIFGTSAISDPVLVVSDEDNAIFTEDIVSGFHGMTIDGVECIESDGSTSWDDTIITEYEFVNWSQFVNNLPISFTITVPSAGTLVMGCKDDEDDSIAQAFSITGSGILSDRVTAMSRDWNDPNSKWGITNFYKTGEADYVRRVKVSKGTTLTFTRRNDEDLECEFTRINFFPQDGKSVAINVAYVCKEEMNGILGNEYWGRHYLKGYVKESGVYKKGETATFEAVSGEGEVFDHWEVCFGPLSLAESQRTSPRLSFVITDEMCGDMADEAQIFLRAVWKPKYKITALPSIVGAGKVEGSGRYFEGETVTLTATAASGCTFIKWSDGETSPTRTIEVVPANVERVIYAYFSAPDGVPDPLYWSVVFVGNGGEVGETDRLVRKGTAIGDLPVLVMEGYEFMGWFTANEGGEEIRSDSVISRDLTLYARWREIPRTPAELFGGEWKSGVEGTADAGGYKDLTVVGGVSVKFTAGHESEAWIETEVTNGCRVIFSWKANCEDLFKGSPYDYLSFEVDGIRQGFICGDKDWEDKSFVVSGKGVHHLRWTFRRDEEGGLGNNCAWLANVEITRIYTVEFTGGEATGGEAPGVMEYYEGESVELPDCGSLVRSKHTFAGWNDGEKVYQPGMLYSKNDDSVLTPVWTRNLLQKPVISAPSVFEADTCTVEITATDGAEVRYTLDGTDPTSGSILYSGLIVISGTTTVKAIAVKDNHFESDVSVFTVTRGVWTFGEYLNAPGYIFTESGDAPWVRAKGVSEDGYALRSGEITHAQKSGIEMKVNGPGTISFACRVEGEIAKKRGFGHKCGSESA